ncbi:hypothetical protein HDV63DRAFT_91514 [Trichoderma sp. SZMC 28014]
MRLVCAPIALARSGYPSRLACLGRLLLSHHYSLIAPSSLFAVTLPFSNSQSAQVSSPKFPTSLLPSHFLSLFCSPPPPIYLTPPLPNNLTPLPHKQIFLSDASLPHALPCSHIFYFIFYSFSGSPGNPLARDLLYTTLTYPASVIDHTPGMERIGCA